MAIIERITLPSTNIENENTPSYPGLRISIRSTTSSMSDYPEWRLEELSKTKQDNVVTDGACS
jgi:hypothetical protein